MLGSAGGDLPVEVVVMCYVAAPVVPSFGAMAFPAFFFNSLLSFAKANQTLSPARRLVLVVRLAAVSD